MTKIQLRRDTSTNWTQYNPIPAQGEPCYETDTGKFKIGNGEQHYNDLHYVGGDSGSAVDAYTKQEVDLKLLDKQDILTPVQPLTIQNKIISNLEGLEYTTDGLGIYTSDKDACAGVFNNNGYTNLGENICLCKQSSYTSTDWSDSVIPSKIIIPYTFGQIVKFPYVGYNNPGFAFWGYNSSVDCYYPIFNPTEEDKISVQTVGTFLNPYGFTFGRTSVARTSLENTRLSIVSNVAYAQLIKNTSTFTLVLFYPTGSNTGNLYRVKYELTNNFSKLNEITSFIITPTTKFNVGGSDYGTSESNPIPISSIGLYEYGGDFSILENPESVLTDNLFDLSGQTAKNYLEVQVDGTTITTNSEGQLQANIPSNITTQGNTFNGASQLVQLDSDGKLPAIDASKLTNLPAGSNSLNAIIMEQANFNNYIKAGVYYWSSYTTPVNHPNGNYKGMLQVLVKEDGNSPVVQIFTLGEALDTSTPPGMWIRYCNSGKGTGYQWSSWVKVNGGDAPTNMLTTDTAQDITGQKVFKNTFASSDGTATTGNRVTISNCKIYLTPNVGSGSELDDSSLKLRGGIDGGGFSIQAGVGTGVTVLGQKAREIRMYGTYVHYADNGNAIGTMLDTGNFATLAPTGALKYWTGVETDYTAIETKDADTLYRTTDTNKVFLGEISLTGSGASENLQFSSLQENGYTNTENITIE